MAEHTQEFSNQVAETALRHYHINLPQKAKPKDTEWTVYAAIVAADKTNMWVVSSATGTKCCVVPKDILANEAGMCVLTDCHAEVLARRGLHQVLYTDMKRCNETNKKYLSQCQSSNPITRMHLLEHVPCSELQAASTTEAKKFRLKHNLTLHLYVSDSPCGDASIYSVRPKVEVGVSSLSRNDELQFTGAKVIISHATTNKPSECSGPLVQRVAPGVQLVREQQDQLKGKLRTKSGRSNLEPHLRSQSMCCSDKIARWVILGLQGGIIEAALQDPIRLTTISVSRDPRADQSSQVDALERSIVERAMASLRLLQEYAKEVDADRAEIVRFVENVRIPSVFVVDASFHRGKSATCLAPSTLASSNTKKRKLNSKVTPPSGHCSTWQVSNDTVEIVIGARGLCQGPKPKAPCDYVKHCSKLCRRSLSQEAGLLGLLDRQPVASLNHYGSQKRCCVTSTYSSIREFLLTRGPLAGWLIGDGSQCVTHNATHSLQKHP